MATSLSHSCHSSAPLSFQTSYTQNSLSSSSCTSLSSLSPSSFSGLSRTCENTKFYLACGRTAWPLADKKTVRVSVQAAADSNEKNGEGEGEGEKGGDELPSSEAFRTRMERMLANEDEAFRGKDLASLIRNKYGKSYDVQLIKKEFMGRQLLAMNVMWKYREQKSFPLTEEEYIYHLDSVADNLRCWGAVSTVRSSLAKTKERPRIGKAVSIFIDMDDTGGRANEWINR